MTGATLAQDVETVCDAIRARRRTRARTVVAVAGPPASGKSTLAEAVVQRLNQGDGTPVPTASLLPMDGYHLDNRLLESRNLLSRKGAPETFNAHGFCDAVKRLTVATRETYHPRFDRRMDLSIANAIAIHPDTPVVVVEGNYLLLTSEPWSALRSVFCVTVLLSPAMAALKERLYQRWIAHGLAPEAAKKRAAGNDLPNAELVLNTSRPAQLTLNQDDAEFCVRHAH